MIEASGLERSVLHAATKDHYGIGVGRRVSDDPSVCNSRKKRRANETSEKNGKRQL